MYDYIDLRSNWTLDDLYYIVVEWFGPKSQKEIAKELKRTEAAVANKASRMGLVPRRNIRSFRYDRNLLIQHGRAFLKAYKETRHIQKAVKNTDIEYWELVVLHKRSTGFKNKLLEIDTYVKNTLWCSKCKQILPTKDFYSAKESFKSDHCKKCRLARQAKYTRTKKGRVKNIISSSKNTARKAKLPFNLTRKYVEKLFEEQNYRCYYTNLPIETGKTNYGYGKYPPGLATIDRKIPSLGYVKGNVVLCRWEINKMKLNIPHDDFIQLCREVLLNRN